jgi:hypothetical protein
MLRSTALFESGLAVAFDSKGTNSDGGGTPNGLAGPPPHDSGTYYMTVSDAEPGAYGPGIAVLAAAGLYTDGMWVIRDYEGKPSPSYGGFFQLV